MVPRKNENMNFSWRVWKICFAGVEKYGAASAAGRRSRRKNEMILAKQNKKDLELKNQIYQSKDKKTKQQRISDSRSEEGVQL
jgi:hypothetical protein